MHKGPLPVDYSGRGWAGMTNPWKKRAQEEALEELRKGSGGGGSATDTAALRLQLAARQKQINTLRQELDKAKERFVNLRTEKRTAELETETAERDSANAFLATQQMQQELDDSEAEVARLTLELASTGVDQNEDEQRLRYQLAEAVAKLGDAERRLEQSADAEEMATLRDQVATLQRTDRELRGQINELEADQRLDNERDIQDPALAAQLAGLRQ